MKWLAVLLLWGTMPAQTVPAFDAASVKEVPEPFLQAKPVRTARRITWTTDLTYLTAYAWHIPRERLQGVVPGSNHIYRVEAVTDHDATDAEMRLMMRTLLATRFKQVAHIVTKETEGVTLVLGKAGMKVKETRLQEDDKPSLVGTLPKTGITRVASHRATIDELADSLALFLNQPVWNQTGLTGTYDYEFQYAQSDDPAVDAPSLENALRDTLGLDLLKKQRGRVEFLVVDSMKTDPGEN